MKSKNNLYSLLQSIWHTYSFPLFFVFILLSRYWLGANQIMTAVGGSFGDDQLFINQAQSIIQGHWLGSYSQYTFMRGPMYSLWIAFSYWLHIPLLISQQLLYIGTCILLYRALRMRYKKMVSFIIFFIVLFNPVAYQVSERVLRYHFYTSLTIGLAASTFGLSAALLQRSKHILWTILFGIFLAMFYLTREEFIWIIPILTIPVICYIRQVVKKGRITFNQLFNTFGGFILGGLCIATIALINYVTYGAFVINDLKEYAYPKVYTDLLRIKQDISYPYVLVPKEVIQKASAVSYHTSLLLPLLTGPFSNWAVQNGKENYGLTADEITGAHFIFLVRSAAAELGYFTTYKKTQTFFRNIHKELFTACQSKKLDCVYWPFSLFPIPKLTDITSIFNSFKKIFILITTLYDLRSYAYTSTGSTENILLFSITTRQKNIVPHQDQIISDRINVTNKQTPIIYLFQRIYKTVGSFIILIGIAWYLFSLIEVLVHSLVSFTFLFTTGVVGSIILFFGLFSFIDAVCFPTINIEYIAPSYPLLLLFGGISIFDITKNKI